MQSIGICLPGILYCLYTSHKAHLVATFCQLKIKLAVIKVNAALSLSYPAIVLSFHSPLITENCLQSAADRQGKNKVSYFASWKMQQGANQA